MFLQIMFYACVAYIHILKPDVLTPLYIGPEKSSTLHTFS